MSLKGRFETIKMPNWSISEMQQAFGFTTDEYIYYGAYHDKDTSGLHTFNELYHPHRSVLVGEDGIPLETFLHSDLKELFA